MKMAKKTSTRVFQTSFLDGNMPLWLADGAFMATDNLKIKYEENDNAMPATAEIQFGKMHSRQFGYYADLKAGLGSDRPFDWGVGIGARFVYQI